MKKLALPHKKVVFVCMGGPCCDKKAKKLRAALKEAVKERGRDILVAETSCLKACEDGPHVLVSPKGGAYSRVKPKDAADIIDRIVSKSKDG